MGDGARDPRILAGDRRGISLIEIVLVLLVVVIAGVGLRTYLNSTTSSLDQFNTGRPMGHARLLADMSNLGMIRTQLDLYRSRHGEWPPSREAVAGLLSASPRFQCPGNDYTYEPATGAIGLLITDPSRC
jgi:type II secretory pathway pseudopilin PulG